MRLRPSAVVTGGAPLLFLAAPGSRGLLPGPAIYRSPRRATGNAAVNYSSGSSVCLCPSLGRRRGGVHGSRRRSSSSSSRTIMQFGRTRVVGRRAGPKPPQQTPAPPARHEAAATAAVQATRRGGATTALKQQGSGTTAAVADLNLDLDLDRRRGTGSGGEGRAAATATAEAEAGVVAAAIGTRRAKGAGGSARQNLRHSVKGLPRLSREDELALCKDVQRWQRVEKVREWVSLQRAFALGGDGQERVGVEAWAAAAGMNVADLRELVERGTEARERLVLSHVRLVMYLAGKRGGRTALSSMDLIQEGAIALHLAVERYDPGRGVRFFTYADWSLRAAFEKAEATQATTIAMPRYIYVQKRRLKSLLGPDYGPQTRKDLAVSLGISELQVSKLLRWANESQISDKALVSRDTTLGDSLPSAQSSEAILRRLDAEASVVRLLGHLKPQEEHVIIHSFGLFGKGRKSFPAVAAVMGVSRQYVGRVHRAALTKMRASFEGEQRPALRDKTTSASASTPASAATTTSTAHRKRLRRLASKRLLSSKATERLVN